MATKKLTYSEKLQDPRWQRKRLEILGRDNFTCTLCGDKETTLHVHHEEYNGEPWEADTNKLKSICKHCHHLITTMEKNGRWETEFITQIIKFEDRLTIDFYVVLNDSDFILLQWDKSTGVIEPYNYIDLSKLKEVLPLIRDWRAVNG